MLSGGIDSPVAGYMIAKRGVTLDAVYFHSPPYTSERAKDKVVDLAKIVAQYSRGIKLYVVPFTDIQLDIIEKCPKNYLTVIMRRIMMRIAEKIALSKRRASAYNRRKYRAGCKSDYGSSLLHKFSCKSSGIQAVYRYG